VGANKKQPRSVHGPGLSPLMHRCLEDSRLYYPRPVDAVPEASFFGRAPEKAPPKRGSMSSQRLDGGLDTNTVGHDLGGLN